MPKKVAGLLKLLCEAGKASPAPPIGPALGQKGVNIMEFCKSFNAQSEKLEGVLPVVVTVYEDRTFTFEIKTPPVSYLIKKAANLKKRSSDPKSEIVGSINNNQVKEIAEIKLPDLNAYTVEQAMEIVKGTARSMGIEVE